MTSNSLSCAGCRGSIRLKHYLTCNICSLTYDLECANISQTRFGTLTKEKKSAWKCRGCLNKPLKTGNTPVGAGDGSGVREKVSPRQISPMSSGSETDNVTVCRGSGGVAGRAGAGQARDHSYLEDTSYLENIRSVIRDEFERVMVERMSILITKVVTEQVTTPIYSQIAELTERVVTLESELKELKNKQPSLSQSNDWPITQSLVKVDDLGDEAAFGIKPCNAAADLQVNPEVNEPMVNPVAKKTAGASAQWTEVTKKHHSKTPAGVMRGVAVPGATKLEAAERRRQLHLYYVKVGTTEAEIREHLNSIQENGTYIVESLKARGNYASFKLDVPSRLAEAIMSPENWTEDICIKPWRQSFRAKSKEGRTS